MVRRQGVSAMAGTFWVCSNYQAEVVPTKPRGVLDSFPSPGVLSRASPVITASPFCPWTLLSRLGSIPPLEPHTLQALLGSTPTPHPRLSG